MKPATWIATATLLVSTEAGPASSCASPIVKPRVLGADGASKRATAEQIAYKGNTGSNGYGSNMKLFDVDHFAEHDFTLTLWNAGKSSLCKCWNKIGPDGGVNGAFGHEALSFTIGPNDKKYVAFEPNTQGACACFEGNSLPMSPYGEFASTWAEFDLENASNNHWSGGDASCLVAAKYGLTIPGLKLCHKQTCSIIWPGGHGFNAFISGTEYLDGLGLNIPERPVHLEATVNFRG